MDIGLHALGIDAGVGRETIDVVASPAEACGFTALWVGEHVIAVETSTSRYPYSPTGRIAVPAEAAWNDPMITLSFAAAASTTIRLATGVLLVPEHNPSSSPSRRLRWTNSAMVGVGVGLGWSRDEFTALGIPYARRGERTEQYVRAMRSLWRDDPASFDSEFLRFDAVRMHPKRSNGTSIPVVLGGNSDSALRRVAAWADGRYGFNLDTVAAVADRLKFLEAACREAERDMDELQCTVALRDPTPGDLDELSGRRPACDSYFAAG